MVICKQVPLSQDKQEITLPFTTLEMNKRITGRNTKVTIRNINYLPRIFLPLSRVESV